VNYLTLVDSIYCCVSRNSVLQHWWPRIRCSTQFELCQRLWRRQKSRFELWRGL